MDIVRRKSERQRNYAIVLAVLGTAFVGGGAALEKKAKSAAGPGLQPQGMHLDMQQQGMQQQGGPPGGYPPQGGGGMPQA